MSPTGLPPDDHSASPAGLERLIAEILLAEERGEPVDREAMLAEHPELAEELRGFLADHDALKPSTPSPCEAPTTWYSSGDGPLPQFLESEKQFGDYELQAELGRGGMGIVYRARQVTLGKSVALKTLLPGALHDPSAVKRFYTEAESAARLDHPGIVPVYDVGEHQGRHYYAMALIEGCTLAQRLAEGPLAPREAAELVRRAACAVEHAHSHGVIHRDLKPANILIDSQGEPRITDFGLAKRTEDPLDLTMTGQIIGTLAYMAPEQAAGRSDRISASVDIYALGAVLYTAITGRPPFLGESHAELLVKVLTTEPPMPRTQERCPDLVRICLRCLEKDPLHRYPTAAALAEDLDRFVHDEPVQASSGDWGHRLKKWIRRQPSLAAHLLGLSSFELVRHSKHLWLEGTRDQDLRISSLIAVWVLVSFAMQYLVHRVGESARYLWSVLDLVLLTWVLTLVDDPYGPLLATYPMAIVFCGLLYRARLVIVTTAGAAVGYLALLGLRPSTDPPHYHLLFVLMLMLFGTIIGMHLRRLRLLDQIYRRRVDGGQ